MEMGRTLFVGRVNTLRITTHDESLNDNVGCKQDDKTRWVALLVNPFVPKAKNYI
jgi:hypothetical protein